MTRISSKLSGLALGVFVLAACNKSNPPGVPTTAFNSPTDQQTLTAADGTASNGNLTITITAKESGFLTAPLCDLFVDGTDVKKNQPPDTNGNVTFTGVTLTGGTPATTHALKIVCTDISGQTATAGPITVKVQLGSTGPCGLTIAPPNSTVFNESGVLDGGNNTVIEDSELSVAGMQATITVTMDQDGGACPDGPVILMYGDGGGNQPAPINSTNGVAHFVIPALPETTAAALGDVTKQLAVTAAADASSVTAHYVVDSVDPTCTIAAPPDGATLTGADDIDPNTPGVQVTISGTCQGLAGTTPVFSVVDPTSGQSDGTVTAKADGTFTGTVTLPVGTDEPTLSGTSVTGNPVISNTITVTVNNTCPVPTLAFTTPTDGGVFNLADDANSSPTSPGFQILLHLPTNAPSSDTVEICSTVPPVAGATPCSFGTGLFEVAQANPSGGVASPTVTLGDDGAAANQTLSAQVTNPCGNGSASVTITVHALTPVIDSIVVQNDFVDDAGQIWLNNADLQGGGAATDVVLTADAADVFAGDGGATVTIKNPQGQTVFTGVFSLGPPPTATVHISGLADGPYTVIVGATDLYGNPSDTSQSSPVMVTFPIFVKTSLPTCTVTPPSDPNGCYNILDNGGTPANGAIGVPIVVTASNASFDDNGATIDGTAAVTVGGGGQASDPIDSLATVKVTSGQGANSYSATVADPAGNPAASCTPPAVSVNVSTVTPTVTIAPQGGGAADANGCLTYAVRDGVVIDINQIIGLPNGTNLIVYATGPNGGSTAKTSATVSNGSASATLNGLPNGDDTLVVTGADSCGNPATSNKACVGVNAPGCDLSLVSPVPTTTDAGESVVLNASQVDDGGDAPIELHTSCAAGTQVQFDSTASGGSDVPLDGGVDANGDVTFDLTGLVDGSSGTFTADISGGEALPTIDYDAKLSLPAFTSAAPVQGTLEVVANQDNLILSDAGVTSLAITGGTIVANEAQCTTTACADFSVSGISGLGPVDANGNIGTATLALTGFTQTTANPNPITIASGTTTVTFKGVSMPAVDTGTVTLTLTDNVGNTTSETWTVSTDSLQPPAPGVTAAISDKRTASVKLSWTVPASNGDSATQGYELAYNVYPLSASPPATPSEVTYGTWTLDPGIAGTNGAVGANLTYTTTTALPPLNQYTFELRAIDAVGNRSPLVADATAADVSSTDTNAWQTVTITDNTDTDDIQDFGYLLRSGDFNGDGMKDLAIAAPSRFGAGTPGIVYVMNGAADLSKVTFAGLTSITLGGAANDYFGLAMHVADYNCDGIEDLAVGAPVYNNDQGRVDIFYGHKPGGLSATPDVSILGDSTDTGLFGHGIGTADVNGDGAPDLLVGAPGTSSGSGALYVFPAPAACAWALPDAGLTFASAASAISGNAGDGLGAHWGITSLTDIDADGKEDIAVGAPGGGGNNGITAGQGSVYGFTGKSIMNNATLTTSDALFTLTNLTGTSNCNPAVFGYSSSVGDIQDTVWACLGVNVIGDKSFTGGALPDLLVTSGYASSAFLFTMAATGPNVAKFVQMSDPTGVVMGWSAAVCDLNGDGKLDFLTGENNSSTSTNPDNVFLFSNNGTTLSSGKTGEIFGPITGDYWGYGVAAGDFQGTGKQNFAISDEYPPEFVTVYY